VIHATDKASGTPLQGANVSVYGQMLCPMTMSLVQRTLHEAGDGTYKGKYPFIMPGEWNVNVIFRSKDGSATTSNIPVTIKSGR
jgi:hypothetical protein